MIRRHMTALRIGLMAIEALSAFGLFIVVSVLRRRPGATADDIAMLKG